MNEAHLPFGYLMLAFLTLFSECNYYAETPEEFVLLLSSSHDRIVYVLEGEVWRAVVACGGFGGPAGLGDVIGEMPRCDRVHTFML